VILRKHTTVGHIDRFTKESCFAKAMFGQYTDNEIDLRFISQKGFFLTEGTPVNTSVSALAIFGTLTYSLWIVHQL
jgi:hypothetical protein